MGVFDTVYAKCPNCGEPLEFQSKAGGCDLKKYHHTSVPAEIAQDLHDYSEIVCGTCWSTYKLTADVQRVCMTLQDINDKNDWD